VQILANGDLLVGWGENPVVSELDPNGQLLFDLHFGTEGTDSYRAFRSDWHGRPAEAPAIAVDDGAVYASWNGATDVARWQLLAGESPNALFPLTSRARVGFETRIPTGTVRPWVRVRALDAEGAVLGTSRAVETRAAGPE
jgi:hypothetical protein